MFGKKAHKISYEVKAAKAARALFPEARGMIPKISLTFDCVDGTIVEFELEAIEAARLIEQAMSAYNAILPPLKTARGGYGM